MNHCLLKSSDMLDGDNVDEAKAVAYFEKSSADPSFKPVIKQAIGDCFATVGGKMDEIMKMVEVAPFNIKPDQCNIKNWAITFCSTLLTFTNCPKNMSKDDQKCNDLRAYVKKCMNNIDNVQNWFTKMSRM